MGEEGRDLEGPGQPCSDRHEGGEENGEVHDSWVGDDQDKAKTGHEGGDEGDVREDCQGEGHEGENHREGPCSFRPEEEHLRWKPSGSVDHLLKGLYKKSTFHKFESFG